MKLPLIMKTPIVDVKTPSVLDDDTITNVTIFDSTGVEIAVIVNEDSVAAGEFITRACNAHEQLVAALKELHDIEWSHWTDETVDYEESMGNGMAPIIRRVRAALTAAGAA